MVPVDEEIEIPEGRFGEIDQEVTVPPEEVGVWSLIAVLRTRLKVLGEYDTEGTERPPVNIASVVDCSSSAG